MKGKGKRSLILFVVLVLGFTAPQKSEAFIFINEILADPASGLAGDANNDGVRSSTDDEFIELFNLSSESIDISQWYIMDAIAIRHIFSLDSIIGANSTFVIFGGGSPSLPGVDWQTASNGSLSLNNGGDTITLYDVSNQVVDFYTYGSEAGDNQSIVRNPEGSKSDWIKHTQLSNASGKLFSPGYLVNEPNLPEEEDHPEQSTVPEPSTMLLFGSGLLGSFIRKRRHM